jgi:transcriptional regulator with XRE-family HTH domain
MIKKEVNSEFGEHIKTVRLKKLESDPNFSLRKVAKASNIKPGYLCKIENCEVQPPGEDSIKRLAGVLGENQIKMLVLADKIPRELKEAISKYPEEFEKLIKRIQTEPINVIEQINNNIDQIIKTVRDGKW